MHRALTAGLVAVLALSLMPSASAQDVTLSGQVLDQDGQPVAGADVRSSQWSGDGAQQCEPSGECRIAPSGHHEASTTTDADGRFSIAANDGPGSLSVWKEGYAEAYVSFDDPAETVQVELLKFPEKTARIEGTVRGADGPLPYARLSVESPVYGVHECSVREGESKVSGGGQDGSGGPETSGSTASSPGNASDAMIAPHHDGCTITVREDGTFEGLVTPGYSIVRFSHDNWRDGGPEYHSLSRVIDLPAGQTTRLDVQLSVRPGPDALLGGHVIDKATQDGIAGAKISFSSQDSHGWADAATDGDGSYQVRLRSGYVQIHVWAQGYLPWEGQVALRSGGDAQRFTIELTQGEARWSCCIAYAEAGRAGAPADSTMDDASQEKASIDGDATSSGSAFEDLGGGLGPYDASRADDESDPAKGAPGFETAAVALGLLAVLVTALVLRRR